MTYFLYALIYFLQSLFVGYAIHTMLTPKYSTRRCISWWLLFAVFICVGRFARPEMEHGFMLLNMLAYAMLLLLPLFLYQEPLWKRLVAPVGVLGMLVIADICSVWLVGMVNPAYVAMLTEINPTTTYIGLFVLLVLMIILSLGVRLWKALFQDALMKNYLPTLIMPLAILVITCALDAGIAEKSIQNSSYIMVIGVCLIIMLSYWLYDLLFRKKEAERAIQMQELRHAMELEMAHYRDMENKRDEVSRLRHDMRNQLAAMKYLYENGKEMEAREMNAQLMEAVEQTNAYIYCGISAVNAVMSEKQETCREQGIHLDTDLQLPENLHIPGTTLCSIFGNLADNAIRAVKSLEEEERWIRISAIADGGMLVIRTTNPSDKPEPVRPGHGYGTAILKHIAKEFHGDYRTEYKDGRFTAVIRMEDVEE